MCTCLALITICDSCSSQDCTIKVWETTQGKLIRELKVFFFLFLLQIYLVGKHSGSIWSETSPDQGIVWAEKSDGTSHFLVDTYLE